MTLYSYQLMVAGFALAAAVFWGVSTLVKLDPWDEVPKGSTRAAELAVNDMKPKQWYGALKRQSTMNAIAAFLSGVTALLQGVQVFLYPSP